MAKNRRALTGDIESRITIDGDMNIPKLYLGDIDTEMSDTSVNAVQNKVIKAYVDEKIAELMQLINHE